MYVRVDVNRGGAFHQCTVCEYVRTRLENLDQTGDVTGVEERDPDKELWWVGG